MNDLSIQEVFNNKSKYNLAIPFTEFMQADQFFKISVAAIFADTSPEAAQVFKVGSRKNKSDKWEDLYSLTKPFLEKLATEAGIQFAPGAGDVVKVDENTWKASAYGALTLPDGGIRTSSNFKVIDLATEERKYRLSYEEKSVDGITDYKKAKDASEKYRGRWEETGVQNEQGYPVKKYVIAPDERGRYVEQSLLDAMTQLRANAPQKAATGAILRVIRELLGIKGTYTLDELKKPFAVARRSFSPDYSDPVVKQMMLQQAIQSVGNIFGNARPIQAMPLPMQEIVHDANVIEEQDSFYEEPIIPEVPHDSFEDGGFEERRDDWYCDKCGTHITEKIWDYSTTHYGRPLCYGCQKKERRIV